MDAIVIPIQSKCLRKSILARAGVSVQKCYRRKIKRHWNESFRLFSGNLNCQRIYFLTCPDLSRHASDSVFARFVSEAVRLAISDTKTTVRSIAYPAIGCGNCHCDSRCVAKALITTANIELQRNTSGNLHIYFLIEPGRENIYDDFQDEFRNLQNIHQSNPLPCPPVQPRNNGNKINEFVIQKYQLSSTDSQYREVTRQFWVTMTANLCKEIVAIELIRNDSWAKQYQILKEEFAQRLHHDTEKLLFHGCSESAANSIINTNFDRSYAGQHGMYYG